MADAFENIIQHSYTDKDIMVRPLNVVHDSAQFYFDSSKIFIICQYYYKHMREYLFNKYQIDYAFDVEIGSNYYDMCDAHPIDEHTLTLTGNWKSITGVLKRLDGDGVKYNIDYLQDDDENQLYVDGKFSPDFKMHTDINIVAAFNNNGFSAVWELDSSHYKIQINNKTDE